MKKLTFALLLIMSALLSPRTTLESHSRSSDAILSVNPATVKIGALYHGSRIKVLAETPICEGVVVKLESQAKKVVLNRKAKIGFIWMNASKVTVEGAPEVYVLAASADVEKICSAVERERLGIGVEALENKISFASEKPLTGQEFSEFLKLKRHTGKYKSDISAIFKPDTDERQHVTAELPLPSVTPAGSYTVRLYCFDGGELIETTSAELKIEMVGLPRLESELAHEHAGVYGIAAILVAMVAGIAMGALFYSRGGGGH